MRVKLPKRILTIIGSVLLLLGILLLIARFYPTPEPRMGVSFSLKYAEELGIDPQEAMEEVLAHLQPDYVRLMSYWDYHERAPGEYEFSQLDWQLELAEDHEVEVLLAIGQRQPRWPECHIPEWAQQLEEDTYRETLLDYLGVVVDRYRGHAAVTGYHLENEAANRSFGICPDFDNRFLREKFEKVKTLDPVTPVTLSVSNQYGVPLQPPIGDKYAMSIYRQAHFQLWGRDVRWDYSFVPAEWHRLRTWMIAAFHNRPTYIHELQTEPWGEQATVNLSLEEQEASMNLKRIRENVEYAHRIGSETLYLWGAEWWYWRLTEFDDVRLWNGVAEVF